MRQCDGKLCALFRASITIPDGWAEDKEASDYFEAQMLLPKGLDFEKAPAKIYAVVRYNRDKQPISDRFSARQHQELEGPRQGCEDQQA